MTRKAIKEKQILLGLVITGTMRGYKQKCVIL